MASYTIPHTVLRRLEAAALCYLLPASGEARTVFHGFTLRYTNGALERSYLTTAATVAEAEDGTPVLQAQALPLSMAALAQQGLMARVAQDLLLTSPLFDSSVVRVIEALGRQDGYLSFYGHPAGLLLCCEQIAERQGSAESGHWAPLSLDQSLFDATMHAFLAHDAHPQDVAGFQRWAPALAKASLVRSLRQTSPLDEAHAAYLERVKAFVAGATLHIG